MSELVELKQGQVWHKSLDNEEELYLLVCKPIDSPTNTYQLLNISDFELSFVTTEKDIMDILSNRKFSIVKELSGAADMISLLRTGGGFFTEEFGNDD